MGGINATKEFFMENMITCKCGKEFDQNKLGKCPSCGKMSPKMKKILLIMLPIIVIVFGGVLVFSLVALSSSIDGLFDDTSAGKNKNYTTVDYSNDIIIAATEMTVAFALNESLADLKGSNDLNVIVQEDLKEQWDLLQKACGLTPRKVDYCPESSIKEYLNALSYSLSSTVVVFKSNGKSPSAFGLTKDFLLKVPAIRVPISQNNPQVNGTWISEDDDDELTFSGSNFTSQVKTGKNWKNFDKGKFFLNETQTKMTLNITHEWKNGKWVEDPYTDVVDIRISGNTMILDDKTYTKK